MKKFLTTTLVASLALLSVPSFANLSTTTQTAAAPVMRGEINTPVQNANAANLLTATSVNAPKILATVSNAQTIATVRIPADKKGKEQLDVTLFDDFVEDVSPNARHYPTNFPSRTAEYNTTQTVKYLSDWIEPYATAANASFDVVLRAAKINGMARNLNIGETYSLRANNHMAKAIKLQPNHAEANFLYGMMISEAGGFKEGKKYLDKAVSLGYAEAEQSLAQTDLLSDNKTAALNRLKALQAKHPANTQITEQIRIVENGGFYIWKIADNNLSVKPVQ